MGKLGKFFDVPIDWNKSFHSQALAKLGSGYVE